MNIETPIVDQLFNWQWPQTPEQQAEVEPHNRTTDPRLLKRMVYAQLGRLLYTQNELDNYETILMIVGASGTGKSSLMMLLDGGFYDANDVAVMSGSSEGVFGISQLINKRLLVVAECGHIGLHGGRGLSEDDLLKLVSGDRSELRVKNETPRAELLKPAIFLVGNQVPKWQNSENAMSRRLFYCRFNRKIPNALQDSHLKVRIREELPNLLVKISRAYQWFLRYMEGCGIKHVQEVMPEHVRENIIALGGTASVLEFLQDCADLYYDATSPAVFSPEEILARHADANPGRAPMIYMPYNHLHEMYIEWCNKHKKDAYGKRRGMWNKVESMVDWRLALKRFYNNADFVREGDDPVKVRLDYPRNSYSQKTDNFYIVNLDNKDRVHPEERDAIENRYEQRSFNAALGRGVDSVRDDEVNEQNAMQGIDEVQRLYQVYRQTGCPVDQAVDVNRKLQIFRKWWDDEIAGSEQLCNRLPYSMYQQRYLNICRWVERMDV